MTHIRYTPHGQRWDLLSAEYARVVKLPVKPSNRLDSDVWRRKSQAAGRRAVIQLCWVTSSLIKTLIQSIVSSLLLCQRA
jgi:hypothetical protein